MTSTDIPESDAEAAAKDRPPFSAWLTDHRYGDLNTELTDALAELVDAVISLDKGGDLTLKIKVSPHGNGQILLKDTVSVKLPDPPAPESFYFADPAGGLSRRDPRQPQLPDID